MKIPFYFDYACPWAFLGSCRVESYFADLGVEIDFRPVILREMVERSPGAGKLPEMGPRKKQNYMNDLRHWAELSGATISPEARKLIKSDTRPALRAALVCKEEGAFHAFHDGAYRARWSEARDLSEKKVLSELLTAAGLNADVVIERAESEELVDRLAADTREAIERGVFGVPTLFVGDEMFWGNDRFEVARHYIEKAR